MSNINAALIECVRAAGGSKIVGGLLWPEVSMECAQRKLLDALNPERAAHLTPEQAVLLLRLARERGCHTGMATLADELSYAPPVPLEPRDAADDLRRKVLDLGRGIQFALDRLEAVERAAAAKGRSA